MDLLPETEHGANVDVTPASAPIHSAVVRRLIGYWSLLRAGRDPRDTPESRGRERLRLVALATVTSVANRAAAALFMVSAVAVTSRYLDKERFGLWMTLLSFVTLLAFADFGLNSGLVNQISDHLDDAQAIRAAIADTLVMLAVVSGGVGFGLLALLRAVHWASFFNLSDPLARSEVVSSLAVFCGVLLANNVVRIIQRIQMGLQLTWRANLWSAAGQIMGLLGVLAVVWRHGTIPWLLAAAGGGPILGWLVNCIDFFLRTHPQYRPDFSAVTLAGCRLVTGVGLVFMLLEGMALIGNASDNVIIAHFLGARAVASYAVGQRLVNALWIAQFFTVPLWPAFGEALARGDHAWARRALTKALWVSVSLGLAAAVIVEAAGGWIITVWAGRADVPNPATLAGFAALSVMLPVVATLSTYLNTSSFLKKQMIYYPIAALSALGLKTLFTVRWHQTSGTIWGTVAAFTLLFVVPGCFIAFRSQPQSSTSLPTPA